MKNPLKTVQQLYKINSKNHTSISMTQNILIVPIKEVKGHRLNGNSTISLIRRILDRLWLFHRVMNYLKKISLIPHLINKWEILFMKTTNIKVYHIKIKSSEMLLVPTPNLLIKQQSSYYQRLPSCTVDSQARSDLTPKTITRVLIMKIKKIGFTLQLMLQLL